MTLFVIREALCLFEESAGVSVEHFRSVMEVTHSDCRNNNKGSYLNLFAH